MNGIATPFMGGVNFPIRRFRCKSGVSRDRAAAHVSRANNSASTIDYGQLRDRCAFAVAARAAPTLAA